MAEFKILTVNCRGLRTVEKRRDTFNYLKSKQCQIYCLQDIHCTPDIENVFRTEWGGNCLISSGTNNARGVGIFFSKDLDYNIHAFSSDPEGNFVVVDISIENKKITLISLYGPNKDDPAFFKRIMTIVENYKNTDLIFCGDFNLVQDTNLDYYNYKHINNKKARETLLDIKTGYNLIDPYRELFPLNKKFTWRKRSPLQQSRLDFFLVSESILNSVNNCSIESSYRSDHSMVILKCKFNDFIKSKGLWKFNNSLLKDIDFLNMINKKIHDIKVQYASPVYKTENIENIPDDIIQFTINDQLFLETLLMEIRGKTISYSSYKKKERDKREREIINKINILEENPTLENINSIDILKEELSEIRRVKMEGIFIRSRAKMLKMVKNLQNISVT